MSKKKKGLGSHLPTRALRNPGRCRCDSGLTESHWKPFQPAPREDRWPFFQLTPNATQSHCFKSTPLLRKGKMHGTGSQKLQLIKHSNIYGENCGTVDVNNFFFLRIDFYFVWMNRLLMRNTQNYNSINLGIMWNKYKVQIAIGYFCTLTYSEKVLCSVSVESCRDDVFWLAKTLKWVFSISSSIFLNQPFFYLLGFWLI